MFYNVDKNENFFPQERTKSVQQNKFNYLFSSTSKNE